MSAACVLSVGWSATAAGAGEERVPVIVRLHGELTTASIDALKSRVGDFAVLRRLNIVKGFSAYLPPAQADALSRDPAVAKVESNDTIRATNDGAQQWFGVTKARADVTSLDGDAAGGATTYLPGDLVAAVVDTGIDAGHVALDGGKVIGWHDSINGGTSPYDDDEDGHGTHVSATIAGTGEGDGAGAYKGVAPGAALVGVKVLDERGSGFEAEVIDGVNWVVTNKVTFGIEVMNMSLGAQGCASGTDALSTAVNAAVAAGIVAVVAAGNSGPGACTISSPAAAASAITVGSMADVSQGGFYLTGSSSRGPTASGATKPDVVAPGVQITSAAAAPTTAGTAGPAGATGYAELSGTSMASPFVAGVALLMLDASSSQTPVQIKSRLMSTAVDFGAAGADNDYGAGRVDAYEAIKAAGAALTTGPAVPARQQLLPSASLPATTTDVAVQVTGGTTPLALTLINGGTANYDMSLRDGSTVLASLTSTSRQERITATALAAGTYTVRLTRASGSGGFVFDASGATALGPVNTTLPSQSGNATLAATLTAADGTWLGSGPIAYGYEWQTCDAAGASCTAVAGATAGTIALGFPHFGSRMRVVVTATNSLGSVSASSTPTAAVGDPPGTLTPSALPEAGMRVTVGGHTSKWPTIAQEGQTLSIESLGTWVTVGGPVSQTQWRRCAADGTQCVDIAGANGNEYVPVALDVGKTIRLRVAVLQILAGGAVGRAHAASSGVVRASSAPVYSARPAISGVAAVGQTLTASTGTWSGTPTFAYSWLRCDGTTCEVAATGQTYDVTSADAGYSLVARVCATNGTGSLYAESVATSALAGTPAAFTAVSDGCAIPATVPSGDPSFFPSPPPPPPPAAPADSGGGGSSTSSGGASSPPPPPPSPPSATPEPPPPPLPPPAPPPAPPPPPPPVTPQAPPPPPAPVPPPPAPVPPPPVPPREPASPAPTTQTGNEKANTLTGTARNDTLSGRGGPDVMNGGRGNDKLDGGSGNDRLTGGPGRDVIKAGPGNDVVNARDGERDVVDCGPGRDTATVDKIDVVRACEILRRR